MPQLKINREDLIQALTTRLDQTGGSWLLDLETGQVILASDAVDDLPRTWRRQSPLSVHRNHAVRRGVPDHGGFRGKP